MQTNLFLSAVHFLITLFFLTFGLFCVGIACSDTMQFHLMQILTSYPKIFLSLGCGVLAIAIFLFFSFYVLYRKRVLRFWMTPHVASIQSKLISDALDKHLKGYFPFYQISPQVLLHSKNMEILLTVSPFETVKEEEFLKKAEGEIGKVLHESFGYDKQVLITLSQA